MPPEIIALLFVVAGSVILCIACIAAQRRAATHGSRGAWEEWE